MHLWSFPFNVHRNSRRDFVDFSHSSSSCRQARIQIVSHSTNYEMAPTASPLFRLLTPLLKSLRISPNGVSSLSKTTSLLKPSPSRTFSTTLSNLAGRPPQGGQAGTKDQRISLIRYHLQHPKTPRPLRLSRLRALRHWTIHRAWMLARRKRLGAEERELYR